MAEPRYVTYEHPSWATNGGTRTGAERLMLQEWHHFFENTRRWRNLRKVTIAQVHGDVYGVNESVDNMGCYNALNACFTLHELDHSHWAQVNDDTWPVAKPDAGIPDWRSAPPIVPALKDKVRADA